MSDQKITRGATLAPVVTKIKGEHRISLATEIRGDAPDDGRWIVHHMQPAMARRRAAELIAAAEEAEAATSADLRKADVQRQNEARRQVADDESDRECPSCGAPADETGTSIPEHRPGCPYTVDYRAV